MTRSREAKLGGGIGSGKRGRAVGGKYARDSSSSSRGGDVEAAYVDLALERECAGGLRAGWLALEFGICGYRVECPRTDNVE